MNNRILATAIAAALMGIGTAQAQSGDASTSADKQAGQVFDQLDTDGSGSLSPDELKGMREVMAKRRFDAADTNGDGKIDHDEFMAQAQRRAESMFKRMDANDDGHLDADEARPSHHGMHGKGKKHHDRDDKGAAHERDHAKGDRSQRWFKRMDANGDGGISRTEWNDAMQKMHDRHQRDEADHNG
ncbi:EF-hand domain-containing protein [Salinisphaera sp. T31B1]|uniref:EF-hand domain-containing protein n=1 Tax=Salinisphaera sp. T31B1 TaxID=727963 RepID=UPI00333EFEC0